MKSKISAIGCLNKSLRVTEIYRLKTYLDCDFKRHSKLENTPKFLIDLSCRDWWLY